MNMNNRTATLDAEQPAFATRLLTWHARHGRHDLPWQNTRDPYRIWLSEIMLQQTQVDTVIPYYHRFLARFPNLAALAAANQDDVLALWSGLGYYARARNLHQAAQTVMSDHDGRFPQDADTIATLPGIGRSTAAAIAAFAFDRRGAILDGNVKRVLCRAFGIAGYPGDKAVENRLWDLAESLLPPRAEDTGTYIQAQMDLGATLCTRSRPACERCPLTDVCIARREDRVTMLPTPKPRKTVPLRQVRVAVIIAGDRILLEKRPATGIWGGLMSLPELPDDRAPAGSTDPATPSPTFVPSDTLARSDASRLMETSTPPAAYPRSVAADIETTTATQAANWLQTHLGTAPLATTPLAKLRHTFTHFQLDIEPLRLDLPANAIPLNDHSKWRWHALASLDQVGLPAPIRRILASLCD